VIELVPLSSGLVSDAAKLLSGTWQEPHPTGCRAAISDVTTAEQRIEASLTYPSVAALQDGHLLGYLTARTPRPPGEAVGIKAEMHATAPERRRDIYRRLYAQLADDLTKIGGFTHTIAVNQSDRTTVDCWFELGFGIDQVKGVQALDGSDDGTSRSPDIHVREARASDLDEMTEQAIEVTRFHANSPNFRPALSDHEFIRSNFSKAMDTDRSLVAVAARGNRLSGFVQVNPDHHFVDTATIGIAGVAPVDRHRGVGTATVNFALAWARNRGHHFCAVEWSSANLTSDRFWRSRAFQPLQYKLTRRIDPRIAWAHSGISYDHIRPIDL
jgi:GNAT superfamily N-acetyltransferase